MAEHPIVPYIEQIYRFCSRRLHRREDAEDLAAEILCHVLEGLQKYRIVSLDAWVWRVAHNRYARYVDAQQKCCTVLTADGTLPDAADDYCAVDEAEVTQQYEAVFRALHTLSRTYRDIFVDYYLGELSVAALARKYALSETTVKWRLNVGREKIRKRIGDKQMEKIYRRINWTTDSCNGCMDADRYLHSQSARAICAAAYERPLTVEELSLATGIPTLYIEDELPRLEYGDAVVRVGQKYATNFIVLRHADRQSLEEASTELIGAVADYFAVCFAKQADAVAALDFVGHDIGLARLGYLIIPYVLKQRIRAIKAELGLANGPFPPRKDGGYGWFIVEETADASDTADAYTCGCNAVAGDGGTLYYYLIMKYFDYAIYRGMQTLRAHRLPSASDAPVCAGDVLGDEDAAALIEAGLLVKAEGGYRLNFPCLTAAQLTALAELFMPWDAALDDMLRAWVMTVRRGFVRFVPTRLEDQINQWVSTYLQRLIGQVIDVMIVRGLLRSPDEGRPMAEGVFYLVGDGIMP